MKRAVSLMVLAVLIGPTCRGEHPQSTAIQNQTRGLSNGDIVGMLKSGLSPDIVVTKIKSSPCKFDTSPEALEKLKADGVPNPVIVAMVNAPSVTQDSENAGPCVILKRMGPADEVTSHMYSFGLRGKQFQYVEGNLPEGVKFHGRLTDNDVRNIEKHGGKVSVVDAHYTEQELQDARKVCSGRP